VIESTGDQIGSAPGIHISWTQKGSRASIDGEAIIFRREKVLFLLFGIAWHGEQLADLVGIAKTMDIRLSSAR
jgi:hypothetical protein